MSKDFKLTIALFSVILLIIITTFIKLTDTRPQALTEEEAAKYYRCLNKGNTSEYCLLDK